MQLLRDYYLVLVDQVFESGLTPSGVITSNSAAIHEWQEDRGEFKKRYGTVIALPASFSEGHVMMVDPGLPAPRKFVGHEYIMAMRKGGYMNRDRSNYYPSTFEKYEEVTCAEVAQKVDVKVGEKIYFDEKATEEERFMGMHEGKRMYSIRVNEILCVIREVKPFPGMKKQKRIIMQGGWVLLKPNMEAWEDIEIPLTNGQVLYGKAAPGNRPLQGFVKSVNHRTDLKAGDLVYFLKDADAPITIEGEEYTCMWEDEVIAKIPTQYAEKKKSKILTLNKNL